MRDVDLSRDAEKALRRLPPKHRAQVASKLLALRSDPRPADAKKLLGFEFFRVTVGEYRIVYRHDARLVEVLLIEKRDAVYRVLRRR